MAKAPIRVFSLVVLWLMVQGGVVWGKDENFSSGAAAAAPQGQVGGGGRRAEMAPAMFVFGDSLIDNGNNNNIPSFAKANYLPYGIDFNGGPTGRFSNGYTMVDEIGLSLCLSASRSSSFDFVV